MAFTYLVPTLACLSDETVLVQAWRKTSAYIRYHNWFSDTLELDRTAVNLPDFISSLATDILSGRKSRTDPIRMVPAPKSQRWNIGRDGGWGPAEEGKTAAKIRPLAHVSLRDQVIATAIMMCLANRVETAQGDPSTPLDNPSASSMVSYGNRLFSDYRGREAFHRWGSATLYRAFFEDYQSFLARPEYFADQASSNEQKTFIVQADLRQFYDRVSRDLLLQKIRAVQTEDDDPNFFDFAASFLTWSWDKADVEEIRIYAQQAGLESFDSVTLPQGLVASGFFANVALSSFDTALSRQVRHDVVPGVTLLDVSRYVDDLRLVVATPPAGDRTNVQLAITGWLQALLDQTAPGLTLADEKTQVSAFRADERPMVQQSKRMARIQAAISGGFDPIGGGEILDSVLALVRAQERVARNENDELNPFTPIPDVRDATVDRFAAGRFRKTYRSLRPLLWETEEIQRREGEDDDRSQFKGARTRSELDDETRAFALDLIGKWVNDPSNVRLLRIALDLWPAADVLTKILALLRPFTEKGGRRKAPRRVAWYCLAEILRAGATETGFVEDVEQLPEHVDLAAYRSVLQAEAYRLVREKQTQLPWYLKQQALLFLATNPPAELRAIRPGKKSTLQPYKELIRFLLGEFSGLSSSDFATNAVLARRSYLSGQEAVALASPAATPARLNRIASLDPNFASEIVEAVPSAAGDLLPRTLVDIGAARANAGPLRSLASVVLSDEGREWLRNERSIVSFSAAFLKAIDQQPSSAVFSPSEVAVQFDDGLNGLREVSEVSLHPRVLTGQSLYQPPAWVPEEDRWRFQLGFLLRFILTAQPDFTKQVRRREWKERENVYRAPSSHWYQRIYGLFNGHSAFGDDWLPVTDWTERFLFGLLWWPGCGHGVRSREIVGTREETAAAIDDRLSLLRRMQGTSTAVLPIQLPRVAVAPGDRPLRACIVQTVFPTDSDFDVDDLELASPLNRTRHRRHLSAALAAVERCLALRETHKGRDGRLDWLILPELAVHPDDVQTHLVPFARSHRAIILAGLAYERIFPGQPLVNSALWVLPTRDEHRGLQILLRRQGKLNLAPGEQSVLNAGETRVQPFRPCQWLVGYQWSNAPENDPLWLTAAICYEATDICLAADLKEYSDVFAVPALNRDIATFDQMALALHYHMFQMVIVANNGRYGGSNAYAPFRDAWDKQIFHVHGQPQAAITFFELDHIQDFKHRKSGAPGQYQFKPVPAGSRAEMPSP